MELALPQGLEPRLAHSECAVLPLNEGRRSVSAANAVRRVLAPPALPLSFATAKIVLRANGHGSVMAKKEMAVKVNYRRPKMPIGRPWQVARLESI